MRARGIDIRVVVALFTERVDRFRSIVSGIQFVMASCVTYSVKRQLLLIINEKIYVYTVDDRCLMNSRSLAAWAIRKTLTIWT